MAIDFTRVTREAQAGLDRVRGQGENLLTSAASQAELALTQAKNTATNTVVSVTNQISSVGAQVESAVSNLTNIGNGISIGPDGVINLPEINVNGSFGGGAIGGILSGAASGAMQALGQTENQLKAFASYNYVITLACLTVNELNFPDSTYRVRPPQVTVLKSGGGAPGKALTAYETSDAQLEYFIDDLEISGIISPTSATRSSNATSMSFTVHEPYSMGLFLQTLMIAANKAGHTDYMKAPYALIIEFRGWDDNGNPLDVDTTTRRVFPIKINKVDFDVNAGGSAYSVGAFAWNEAALSNSTQATRSDVTIQGNNLLELLQTNPNSLTSILNRRIRQNDEDGVAINRDEYVIMFPPTLTSSLGISNQVGSNTESRAVMTEEEFYAAWTGNPSEIFDFDPDLLMQDQSQAYNRYLELSAARNNVSATIRRVADSIDYANAIGKATIDSGMVTGGAVPFGEAAFTYDQRTGIYRSDQVQISRDFRSFQFPQGTKVEDIIEELIILSTYGQQAATQLQPDADGMINWFRVHSQTFLSPDEEIRNRSGENPKVYVYAVVPYRVHSSVFSNASQPSVGIEQRKSSAAKTYDYIYTGENDDIIDFEINFNNAFFQALNPTPNGAGGSRMETRDGAGARTSANYGNAEGAQGVKSLNSDRASRDIPNANQTGRAGGSDADTSAIQVARTFSEAITSGVDMITMDLTILGDPYYLADSGQGNYNSPPLAIAYTQDGTMDYQRSEVEVNINFRTPIDYNTNDGTMIFPEDTIPVKTFSGLYKVVTLKSNFSGGKFTQVLSLMRRPNQEGDIGSRGTAGSTRAVTSVEGDNTTRTDTQNPRPAGAGASAEGNAGEAAAQAAASSTPTAAQQNSGPF
jgi:hypothetical protein